jgi:uncharacterized protein GlcG (DUF336 family)
MPKTLETVSLQDAKRMLAAGEAKAEQIGIPYNIAVVDVGGHLVAFSRQDGALIGSIDLAIHKAFTARACDISTGDLAKLAQPGKPLYGIHASNGGKIIIFGGGLPIRRKGAVIGAIGASAGTVEQDTAVAEAGLVAIEPLTQSASAERPKNQEAYK